MASSPIVLCCFSRVHLFSTPWTVALQAPLSMVILQARILEWVAMASSRGSSQARDQTQASHVAGKFFTDWATREARDMPIKYLFNFSMLLLLKNNSSVYSVFEE